MRRLTIDEIEDECAKADMWLENERERHWLEALENESKNATGRL
jgi:hypothetical protein